MPRSAVKWLQPPCLVRSVHAPKASIAAARPHRSPGLPQKVRYSTARERERSKSVDRFYNDILKEPPSKPRTSQSPPPTPGAPPLTAQREETIRKAQVVFGSRLAGPAERRRDLERASTRIAGVLVPPRPAEPDNCCMSGCVNCVWDRYRDELEDWAEKSAQARHALQARRAGEAAERARGAGGTPDAQMPARVASSVDDDGGGSEALWTGTDEDTALLGAGGGGDLFAGVPVGIREFMRMEKKLKEMKQKQKHNV